MFLHLQRSTPTRWDVTDVPAAAGSIVECRPTDAAAPSADDTRKLVDLQRIVTTIDSFTHLALDVSSIPDTAFLDTSYTSRAPPMPSLPYYSSPIAHAESHP